MYGGFVLVAGAIDGVVGAVAFPPAAVAAPPTIGGSIVLYAIGVGVAIAVIDAGVGYLALNICPEVERAFIKNGYRALATDNTMLIGIKKDNKPGIQELKKDGIDIDTLTHLTKEGKRQKNPVVLD